MAEKTATTAPVRVAKVGQSVTEIDVGDADTTVGQVLEMAGMDARDLDVRVNGNSVNMGHKVKPGDAVTLIPKIRGG